MKKTAFTLLATGLFCLATGAMANNSQAADTPEPRPMQKAMQARAGWVQNMSANLAATQYDAVAKDATALATQTDAAAAKLTVPLAKDLTLKISSLAKEVAVAAGKKNGETVKMKLAEIKATCGECNAKIRDKK
jgi:hypothetical protein